MIFRFFPVLFLVSIPASAEPGYAEYGSLLDEYVTGDGVRYEAWHRSEEDRNRLDRVLDSWSTVDPAALDDAEATAFLINLYNAAMIDLVLEEYPLNSVREIGLQPFAVFRKDVIALNGEPVSLDTIEKGILLEEYFDPRIHFAVNCASVSCPPLRREPFTGKALEDQLEEQTRAFAGSPHAAREGPDGETTFYSELFNWYADDFPGEDPATYLNRYREKKLPVGNEIGWIDYDWSLNRSEN